MPFSKTEGKHDKKYWDYFFSRIESICKKNQETIEKMFNVTTFKIHRASAPQGNIVKSILKDLKDSDIVIAVLTDHNANVFYELGIRHAQTNKTIMLCEESQDIPFDLKNYGVGLYKDNKLRYKHIEKELLERFEQIASNPRMPDNPFFDFFKSKQEPTKHKKTEIKVNIVNEIEGELVSYPPKFYREALRKGGGEVDYKDHTFFTFIIELTNYSNEPISIIDTILEGSFSSQNFSTDKVYYGSGFETAKASLTNRSTYKKKFTLAPYELHPEHVTFILDQPVSKEISEISARVHVIDMFNNKYTSPEIKFTPSPYS